MNDGRVRLLAVGQFVYATGYARVAGEILGHLDRHAFDIHQFAIAYRGEALAEPWPLHPNRTEGDPHGVTCLRRLLRQLRPDVVLIVHDTYLHQLLRRVLEAAQPQPRVVVYAPIEGPVVKPKRLAHLAGIDRFVLFHDQARASVLDAFARLGMPPPPLAVIPHGLDAGRFRPIDGGRRAARAVLFPGRPGLAEAFLVLNANRNVTRKRVDLTLEAFAQFARDKPDARLYLHMALRHHRGVDVRDLAARLGIAEKLLVTPAGDAHPEVGDERLHLIYNACDVGLNTSRSEGWGLVAFEHAATGAAQVLPRHSAHAALWEGAAVLVDPVETGVDPRDFVAYETVAPSGVAAALESLYRDRALLAEWSRRAQARAHEPAWRWEQIGGRWSALLTALTR
ncbi:MAG TPA: glycosyltransferase family 4 protein [Thermoanaerobaculia bacterium]|nr:glycosyltransferase family 4 protein [Thermoanaerobaculia bacterium]